ncbi:MAG: hypothetical protein KKB02_12310 [Alphaproteobacteria bacterium]|nr:hypothetical protein [Alphaproteobacteria bacterium]
MAKSSGITRDQPTVSQYGVSEATRRGVMILPTRPSWRSPQARAGRAHVLNGRATQNNQQRDA